MDKTEWHLALCKGQVSLFFSDRPADIERAKDLCELCPIRHGCLMAALEKGEAYGVWGGTTPQERVPLAIIGGYPAPTIIPEIEHGTAKGYAQHIRFDEPLELDPEGNDLCGCRSAYREGTRLRVAEYRKRQRATRLGH